MAEIRYRICDKCKNKIEDEKYSELQVFETSEKNKQGAWNPIKLQMELCENCYNALLKHLGDE